MRKFFIAATLILISVNCGTGGGEAAPQCSIPSYDADYWNERYRRRWRNNCYNYATNVRTNSFAQPGRASGYSPKAITCAEYTAAAVADGLTAISTPNDCQNSECTLALVIAPDVDFHWYRLDANGFWSHKPGRTNATNVDGFGASILNPETADRSVRAAGFEYSEFCGYFCACSDSSQGDGHENVK